MNLYTGVDLVEISRFTKLDDAILVRFKKRVLTDPEQQEVKDSHLVLAGKFAAKEAVVKALGCGIGPVSWQEIEIMHEANGQPFLNLMGRARQLAESKKISTWSISISHTKEYAIAMAVFSGK